MPLKANTKAKKTKGLTKLAQEIPPRTADPSRKPHNRATHNKRIRIKLHALRNECNYFPGNPGN